MTSLQSNPRLPTVTRTRLSLNIESPVVAMASECRIGCIVRKTIKPNNTASSQNAHRL